MIHQFSFDDLGTLDGGALKIAIEKLLKDCVKDCMDRPLESKARTIDLRVAITPVVGSRDIERVEVAFTVKNKLPAITTPRPFSMEPSYNGQLRFNDLCPENPRQETLDAILDNPRDGKSEAAGG